MWFNILFSELKENLTNLHKIFIYFKVLVFIHTLYIKSMLDAYIVSVLRREERYTVKYDLSRWISRRRSEKENPRAQVIFDILNHLTMEY